MWYLCSLLLVFLALSGSASGEFRPPLAEFQGFSQDFQPEEPCRHADGRMCTFILHRLPDGNIEVRCSGEGECYRGHLGEDWRSACGTNVFAVAPGRVVLTQRSETGWGNHIMIRHDLSEGIVFSLYAHLQDINVQRDEIICDTRAKRIGMVGRTGFATGCHLHLGIKNTPDVENPSPGQGYTFGQRVVGDVVDLDSTRYFRPSAVIAKQMFPSAPAPLKVPETFPTIQAAVNAAAPGGTIIVSAQGSPYSENLVITKPLRLVGEKLPGGLPAVLILGGPGLGGAGIHVLDTERVEIKNLSIQNFAHEGIELERVWKSTIENTVIMNPGIPKENEFGHGILLISSHENTVLNNSVIEMADGIELHSSNDNAMCNNQMRRNKSFPVACTGMRFFDSQRNLIEQNVLDDNGEGFGGDAGMLLSGSSQNFIRMNTLRSNLGGGNGGLTIGFDSTNNTIEGNTARLNRDGATPLDLVDFNPGCDANTWRNNAFGTRNQPCIQ